VIAAALVFLALLAGIVGVVRAAINKTKAKLNVPRLK
jgi:hypothetical protein